jgi:hypothetical protein
MALFAKRLTDPLSWNESAFLMDSVFHDLRFGARILWRYRGTSAAVILALALGIGANSAMFSMVDAGC